MLYELFSRVRSLGPLFDPKMISNIVVVSHCSHKTAVPHYRFAENEVIIIILMVKEAPLHRRNNQEGKTSQSVNLEISQEAEQKVGSRDLL